MMTTNCIHCNKEYRTFPSCKTEDRNHFCSKECMKKWYAEGNYDKRKQEPVTKPCLQCGKEYTLPAWRSKRTKFCSRTCGGLYNIEHGLNKGKKKEELLLIKENQLT